MFVPLQQTVPFDDGGGTAHEQWHGCLNEFFEQPFTSVLFPTGHFEDGTAFWHNISY
jgi:hypothetical protein